MNEESKSTAPRIYLAMAAISQDIREIPKDKSNTQQNFKFRGIDDLYNHLHNLFAMHGVVCVPEVSEVTQSEFVNAKGNTCYRVLVKVKYTFFATDGSSIVTTMANEAFDFADKAINKALSACQKYLLIQTFLIPTSDVADSDLDATVYAAVELKSMDESKRRAEEIDRQEKAMQEKREQLRREIEKNPSADYIPGHSPKEIAAKAKSAPKTDEVTETQEKPAGKAPASEPEARKARKTPEKPAEAPAKPEAPAAPVGWRDYVIKEIAMAKFNGRKLGDLSKLEIEGLKTGWVDKYSSKFAGNPGKELEAKMIMEAFEELSGR